MARRLPLFQELPTVVVDAGVGTTGNLKLIRGQGFHYITVSRMRPGEVSGDDLVVIKAERDLTVKAERRDGEGEVIFYCESSGRAAKRQRSRPGSRRGLRMG